MTVHTYKLFVTTPIGWGCDPGDFRGNIIWGYLPSFAKKRKRRHPMGMIRYVYTLIPYLKIHFERFIPVPTWICTTSYVITNYSVLYLNTLQFILKRWYQYLTGICTTYLINIITTGVRKYKGHSLRWIYILPYRYNQLFVEFSVAKLFSNLESILYVRVVHI